MQMPVQVPAQQALSLPWQLLPKPRQLEQTLSLQKRGVQQSAPDAQVPPEVLQMAGRQVPSALQLRLQQSSCVAQ
jgi:hypothetical protein